jgi:mono/diheme cytochrome c family protein
MNPSCRMLRTAFLLLALTGAAASKTVGGFEIVERGRYLAVLGDCVACHTAPEGRPFAGGLELETPFGTLIAPNITPDRVTGIGSWTDEEFIAAMQAGRGRGGKRLYPAMPYTFYTKMSRDDVLAIRAYLATVTPVQNRVVSNQLPFPFNIRLSMAFWNWLNFAPERFREDPRRSAEWNLLIAVPQQGHCGMRQAPARVEPDGAARHFRDVEHFHHEKLAAVLCGHVRASEFKIFEPHALGQAAARGNCLLLCVRSQMLENRPRFRHGGISRFYPSRG